MGDADRAGDIIDRIRDQIKKAPPRKARFDLNEAINEVIALARSAITENGVSVQTRLAEGLPPVQGDRVQLQQVVLNLILNAVEAMSSVEAGARELLISTEQSRTSGVLVAVRDSGPGIDPDHLDRVFEAFYTTKSSGVGMGLSICRSIIDAHGGRLWADCNAPRGAVFQFTLPGAEKELMNSLRRLTRLESRTKTPYQMLLINRLTKVTNDPIVQGAGPVNVIGVGSNEDRRNRVSCIDEVSVELESGHRRHMDVSDQAGRFDETRGCEEIGCRREGLDVVAQRSHEPSHGLAKVLIILDDRDQ